MRNIILIAPPAAGKGTQSQLLCDKYQIPHISTGDLLRSTSKEESELGETVRNRMNAGLLVDDDLVMKILENRIQQDDCKDGYILDGFPRTLNQAERYLELLKQNNLPVGDVIYLDIPRETARKRIVGRLSCANCGAVYNDQFEDSKPKHFGTCDHCNSSLSKRADDNDEVFNERFDTYMKETYPLIEFFEKKGLLFRVGSGISKDRTFAEIEKIINRGNYD